MGVSADRIETGGLALGLTGAEAADVVEYLESR
jgi:hypothetical protein